MLSDLIACLILYYLFFILQNPIETAINLSQPTKEPLDDWESASEGGGTLPCSNPAPPPTVPSRSSTPETIIPQSLPIDHQDHISESYQEYIDSLKHNWLHTKYRSFRDPLPSKRRMTKTSSYQIC